MIRADYSTLTRRVHISIGYLYKYKQMIVKEIICIIRDTIVIELDHTSGSYENSFDRVPIERKIEFQINGL
jgi:hypothetical protein